MKARKGTSVVAERNVLINERDFDRLNGLIQSRETRISYGPLTATLAQELDRGEVVAPTEVPKGVVTMNSRVRLRDIRSDDRESYTLVYPQNADIGEGKLSVLAPLGLAILGAKTGDIVECNTPGGMRKIKIERILYQPEAAGDYHL
jgi:regulator of nucleoside diphosphate kinase